MDDERLGRPYSDGSFWKTNFRCVDPLLPCPPSEGILKIDLQINQTCRVVSVDEYGNCRVDAQELGGLHHVIFSGSQRFWGTNMMRRADYYDRLHRWFCSLLIPLINMEMDSVYDFTDRVVEYVFGKMKKRLAIHVIADLTLVSWIVEADLNLVSSIYDVLED